jgi:hypothetical protein
MNRPGPSPKHRATPGSPANRSAKTMSMSAATSGARHRWGIEAGFLVEKHQGYHYEHAFALDWNAMKGYHLLMRLAHVFNTLARFTRQLRDLYQQLGVRGAIAFIRSSCAAPWLDPARIRALLAAPFLLQLE